MPEKGAERTLPGAEAQNLLDTVVKEAIANFAQARQSFVAFIETNWDSAQLNDVPRLLDEVAGAVALLGVADRFGLVGPGGVFYARPGGCRGGTGCGGVVGVLGGGDCYK